MSNHTKRICLDFDGCVHQYTTEWSNVLTISDPPMPGAFGFIRRAQAYGFEVMLHTSRLAFDPSEHFHEDVPISDRIQAIEAWFWMHDLEDEVISKLKYHTGPGKPHAHVYIDDRAFLFRGKFPTVEALEDFMPWKHDPNPPIKMKQSVGGLFANIERALNDPDEEYRPMHGLHTLRKHLAEFKRRYYAGDHGVVDEFFALYVDLGDTDNG